MPYVNRSLVTTNLTKQFDTNYASSSGVSSSDNLEDDVIVSGRRKSNHRNDWSLPNNQNLNRVKKGYKKPRGLNISVSSSSDSDAGRQPRVGKILSQQQQQQQHRSILSTIPSTITVSKQTLPHVGEGSKQIRSNIIQKVPVQPIARSSPKPKQLPQMSRIRPHTPQPSPNAMLKNLHLKTPTSVERKSTHQPAPDADVAMVISPPPQNEENAFPFTLPPTGDEQTNDEAETETDEDETETETTEEDEDQQQPQQLEQRPQQPQQHQQQSVDPIQFFNHREPTPLVKLEPVDPIEELQQMLPPQLPLNPTKQERFICKQQKKLYDYSRRCQLFKEREIGSKMIFRSQLWNSGMSSIIYNNRYSSGEVNDLMMNLQVVSEILYYELRLDYFQDQFDQQQLQLVRGRYPHCVDCKGVTIEPDHNSFQSVPHVVICPIVSMAIRKMLTCYGYRNYEKELKKLQSMHKKAMRAQLLLQ